MSLKIQTKILISMNIEKKVDAFSTKTRIHIEILIDILNYQQTVPMLGLHYNHFKKIVESI